MKVYLDTGGFMLLFSKEGWEIIEKEGLKEQIERNEITLYISPFTMEEFFYKILYGKEQELTEKFCSTEKRSTPGGRAKAFFENHEEKFAQYIQQFEIVGLERAGLFLFTKKDLLQSLTSNVKTYDLLHLATTISNRLDGFLTTDKKLVRWIQANKKHLKKDLEGMPHFKIFLVDPNKKKLEIYSLEDLSAQG